MKLITRSLGGKCSPLMKHLVQVGVRWVNPRKVVLLEPDGGDGTTIYLDMPVKNWVHDKRSVDEVVAVLHGREVEDKKEAPLKSGEDKNYKDFDTFIDPASCGVNETSRSDPLRSGSDRNPAQESRSRAGERDNYSLDAPLWSGDELKQAIFKGFVIYRGKSTADSPASWSYFKKEILPHVLSALPWKPAPLLSPAPERGSVVDETVKDQSRSRAGQHIQTTRLEQLRSKDIPPHIIHDL